MEVYITAITSPADAAAIVRQLEAAKSSHVARVGMFTTGALGRQSKSVDIDEAIEIVKQRSNVL